MAIPATVTILDGAATPVSQTFEMQRTLPNGSDRIKVGSTLLEPYLLSIRHNSFPKKGERAAYDRRSVSVSSTKVDAEEKMHLATVSIAAVVPRTTEFTAQDVRDLRAIVSNFVLNDAYWDDLMLSKS